MKLLPYLLIFLLTFILSGFDIHSKYLIAELKKDAANKEGIKQVLKYINWVRQEYAFGDYYMINAFLVVHSITLEVVQARNTNAVRNYTKGNRPVYSLYGQT